MTPSRSKTTLFSMRKGPTTPEHPTRARSLARIGSWPAFLYPPDSRKWGRLPSFRRVWVKGQRRYRRECDPGSHQKWLESRPEFRRRLNCSKDSSAFPQISEPFLPGQASRCISEERREGSTG